MLNDVELSAILQKKIQAAEIKDIHWRTQDSRPDSILFYKILPDIGSEEVFAKRLDSAEFSWLIVNRQVKNLPQNSTVIEDKLWPEIQKNILDKLYPLPDIKFIGVTGTNGKTTTADLVLQLGHLIGKNGLSIGTLGVREYNKTILDFGLTSPCLIDLRKYLNRYAQNKDFCVMELSSHALEQNRFFGIPLDAAGWLSFTQDHLDYHSNMEAYFRAKSRIFEKLGPNGKLFVPLEQKDLYIKLQTASSKTQPANEINVTLPLFFSTQFNKNNLEVARAIIEEIFPNKFEFNYNDLKPIEGRFYIQPYKSNFIIVDFAHTPDALENICRGIKNTFPNHKLKVLFGCGGDRDRSKRAKMAAVVDDWANEIYVTSDNPRSEKPEQIINDILSGIKKNKFHVITDRPQAVKLAFAELLENEVLLLAGKGHEDYILKNGIKYPYSDIAEVEEFIKRTKA